MAESIRVEVVFALPQRCRRWTLQLPADSCVADALAAAPLADAGIDREALGGLVGIFGKTVEPGQRLRDGDRIELYRPLLNDPKDVRRRRAAEAAP